MRRAAPALALLLLVACASADRCPPRTSSAYVETLYFGTARPGGVVSAAEFQAFVDTVIAPRFPAGLTFFEAGGRWRDGSGKTIAEASYVVQLIVAERSDEAIEAIIRDYKARFQQESVLRVRTKTCSGV